MIQEVTYPIKVSRRREEKMEKRELLKKEKKEKKRDYNCFHLRKGIYL